MMQVYQLWLSFINIRIQTTCHGENLGIIFERPAAIESWRIGQNLKRHIREDRQFKTFTNRGFQQNRCKNKFVKNFVEMKNPLYLLLLKNQIKLS